MKLNSTMITIRTRIRITHMHMHVDSDIGSRAGAGETGAPVSTSVFETAVEKLDPGGLEFVDDGKPV